MSELHTTVAQLLRRATALLVRMWPARLLTLRVRSEIIFASLEHPLTLSLSAILGERGFILPPPPLGKGWGEGLAGEPYSTDPRSTVSQYNARFILAQTLRAGNRSLVASLTVCVTSAFPAIDGVAVRPNLLRTLVAAR